MSYSRSAATVAGGWDNCIHAARADKQFLGMPDARIPRNAQALARHSTIDLTMNVYTHMAMADLHDDVESLPGSTGNSRAEPDAIAANAAPANAPDGLAELISPWNDLPDNVRSAIAALAKG